MDNERYSGAQEATEDRVRRYLRSNYNNADGSPISYEDSTVLVKRHALAVTSANNMGSYAYYVGDRIAEQEGLQYLGDPEE